MEWYYCTFAPEIRDGIVNKFGVIFNFAVTAFVYVSTIIIALSIAYAICSEICESKIAKALRYHWKHWNFKNRVIKEIKSTVKVVMH